MPTSSCIPERSAGFTLMEMLVVLTIVGLAAALVAARMDDRPGRLSRERTVAALEARIAAARREAVRSGAAVRIDPKSIDPDAEIERAVFGQEGKLAFFPDGSASGGTITVAGTPALDVNWLTGAAARAQ